MLRRFFKHDGAALLRVLWPILAAMVGCAVVGMGLNLLMMALAETKYVTLFVLLTTAQSILVLIIAVLMVIGIFYVFYSFYRSMFTDEGYLTLVLPVGTHTLLLSKLAVGAVFMLGVFAVWGASMVLTYLPMILTVGGSIDSSALTSLISSDSALYMVSMIAELIMSGMLTYAAITLGSIFFTKHKILGAILFSFVLSSGQSIVDAVILLLLFGSPVLDAIALILQILLSLGISVALYFLMAHLIRNKLNLT
ncbi:MAG: hypothetical protein IJW83_02570 [Clostridia bacterium]|nr:hypothetical protein [Clostridia bacterium]